MFFTMISAELSPAFPNSFIDADVENENDAVTNVVGSTGPPFDWKVLVSTTTLFAGMRIF